MRKWLALLVSVMLILNAMAPSLLVAAQNAGADIMATEIETNTGNNNNMKEGEVTLSENTDETIVINDFVNYDVYGKKAYDSWSFLDEDRDDIAKNLPKTIQVVTSKDKEATIPVSWECMDDITKTDYNLYYYELVLKDGYELSDTLQKDLDDYKITLPYIEVAIEKDSVLVTTKATRCYNQGLCG